jgi:hypothetical protein
MHMIPTAQTFSTCRTAAQSLLDVPDGPELLFARFCHPLLTGKLARRRSPIGLPPDVIKQLVAGWTRAVTPPVRDASLALEAIAWAKGMPFLADVLGTEECLALGGHLSSLSDDADEHLLRDQPLLHQLLAGELAWTLAARLIRGAFAGQLEKSGRAAIALGLNELMDRQGMLSAPTSPTSQDGIRIMRPLLACWTRCRALAADLPGGGLGPRPEQRYLRFVRNTLRCNRPDGQPLFAEDIKRVSQGSGSTRGTPATDIAGRKLFEAVLKSGVEEIDRQLAAIALPKFSPPRGYPAVAKPPKKSVELPPPSICFEEGAIAVMRHGWHRDDERLAVLFAGQTCEIELVAGGRLAASGPWRLDVRQDGRQLEPVSHWESSCWYSDGEVDYLELEIELSGGVMLQRQIVLAREDRFLILADAVLCPQRGKLEYRSTLPLVPGVEFRGEEESREGLLVQAGSTSTVRALAHVLPLGMPEWRAEDCSGELRALPFSTNGTARAPGTPGRLELSHGATGERLLAPLFIDLDRRRFRRRMTWRGLTVAEGLTAVGPDKAVGYRVAIGAEQWIFYRSLAAAGNRTVLGHNLSTESLIARFGKDGKVTSIVEIE